MKSKEYSIRARMLMLMLLYNKDMISQSTYHKAMKDLEDEKGGKMMDGLSS